MVILVSKINGTHDSSGKVVIEVKNRRGKVIKTFAENLNVKKGKKVGIKHQLKLPKSRFFRATIRVYSKGDSNTQNNQMKTRVKILS